MPRITNKVQALKDIEYSAQVVAGCIALSKSTANKKNWRNLRTFVYIYSIIDSHRYLSRGDAGRHETDILDDIIYRFSEERFLMMFRMQRPSFWQLIKVLQDAGKADYWDKRDPATGGRPPRPIHEQVAVALYMLGRAGGGQACTGVNLNISKGTVSLYLWRTIKLLIQIMPEYIRWPSLQERHTMRHTMRPRSEIFKNCVGFLDGSVIVLRYKPMVDPEAYYSRKSTYGFNIQAICDWDRRFIWASMSHTASAHDSTVFKSTPLYQNIDSEAYFTRDEYLLADKAYAIERHIITPYKEPIARKASYAAFNYALSIPRVKIEHAFGILKARWPSLYDIPIRISKDAESGHTKVMHWTMTCLVLHNMLASWKDDEAWLNEMVKQDMRSQEHDRADEQNVRENEGESKRAGIRRRDDLRELVSALKRQR